MTPQTGRSGGRTLILWVLVLLALAGGIAGYFVLYPEEMPQWAADTPVGRELQTTTVYKWQDASGAWHVSDQPPPPGTEYEVQGYARDANVLPRPPELQR